MTSIRLFDSGKQVAYYVNCEVIERDSEIIHFDGDVVSWVTEGGPLGDLEYKTIGRNRVRTTLDYVEELNLEQSA